MLSMVVSVIDVTVMAPLVAFAVPVAVCTVSKESESWSVPTMRSTSFLRSA